MMADDVQQDQPKRPRLRVKLDNVGRVASELARVYRAMKQGDLSSEQGKSRAQVLSALRAALEAEQFEKRLAAIEARQASEHAKVIEHRSREDVNSVHGGTEQHPSPIRSAMRDNAQIEHKADDHPVMGTIVKQKRQTEH